ncbi:MAG: hypothetical protein GX660_22905 [Clostridiaceae bacterium]|nr:hypothetical protein [Clostridiaceae bacterium]
MKNQKEICQSCKRNKMVEVFDQDDPIQPYILCKDCKKRLITYSLRPQEWYHLSSIHGPFKPLLHDDFYDDNGTACQPDEPVIDAELFPYPKLSDISSNLIELINYSFSKWYLQSDIIEAFGKHDKRTILELITDTANILQNLHIESRCYEIAAYCLGKDAEDWIRERISEFSNESYFAFFHAVAKCLKFDEAFNVTIAYLENLELREIAERSSILSWFTSSKTLNFIEKHATTPVQDFWGRIACVSEFTWEKVTQWLQIGRPLSLISLDALHSITRYDTLLLQELRPVLLNAPDHLTIINKLREYKKSDPVPRVERIVDSIIINVNYLYIPESSYPEKKKE